MQKIDLKQYKFNTGLASKLFSVVLCIACAGCSSWFTVESPRPNPNVYHIAEHGWAGDSIYFRIYRTSDPSAKPGLNEVEVDCRSCNLINASHKAELNESGMTRIYIPEARQLVSVRLHIRASGIDTTFIQKQRPPKEAADYFKLSQPLTGRVMLSQFAVLYYDSALNTAATSAEAGDELNTYVSSFRSVYMVHHPNFREPLYLLKQDAVRLY